MPVTPDTNPGSSAASQPANSAPAPAVAQQQEDDLGALARASGRRPAGRVIFGAGFRRSRPVGYAIVGAGFSVSDDAPDAGAYAAG